MCILYLIIGCCRDYYYSRKRGTTFVTACYDVCKIGPLVLILFMDYRATVFIHIVSAAAINFSLAEVRLLIKGSSYSRLAFFSAVNKKCTTKGWFMRDKLQILYVNEAAMLP